MTKQDARQNLKEAKWVQRELRREIGRLGFINADSNLIRASFEITDFAVYASQDVMHMTEDYSRVGKLSALHRLDYRFRCLSREWDKADGTIQIGAKIRHLTWEAAELAIKAVALICGDDTFEWCDWYFWDNECGKGDLTACAKTGCKMRKVKSPAGLLRLIEATAKNSEGGK